MECVPKTVCPKCGGKGSYFESGTGGSASSVSCTGCGGSGVVDSYPNDMFQGCNHNVPPGITGHGSPVSGYPRTGATTDPYWIPQPSKTLLDEFAMAALTGALSNPEVMLDIAEEDLKSLAKAYATCSYEYAAAMMAERARRDEMGNVKEVK